MSVQTAVAAVPEPHKTAVVYLRVSTDRQALTDYDADGYSIKAQRDACLKKARELGARVEREYVDRGESARRLIAASFSAWLKTS